MKFIRGMTFAPFIRRGELMKKETLAGFDSMVDRTGADFVIIVPNDWSVRGDVDLGGQADWFKTMFEACEKRGWVGGFAIWDWRGRLYPLANAAEDTGYGIFGKPAEKIVKEYYYVQ